LACSSGVSSFQGMTRRLRNIGPARFRLGFGRFTFGATTAYCRRSFTTFAGLPPTSSST
jgi:hypothetical protein